MSASVNEELWYGSSPTDAAEELASASMAARVGRVLGAKPFPASAMRLARMTRDPRSSMDELLRVLESDPALSARLLRLVNSAGFALRMPCTSVRHAAILVGNARLNQVATTAAIIDMYDSSARHAARVLEHATVVGALCRYLAFYLALPSDELFTCGFLHDIGKLMLLDTDGAAYEQLLDAAGDEADALHHLEREQFGFDHALLAGHVLAQWNIPDPVPKVVAWHHNAAHAFKVSPQFGQLVSAVRLADAMSYAFKAASPAEAIERLAKTDAAAYLGVSEPQLAAMWDEMAALALRAGAASRNGSGVPETFSIQPTNASLRAVKQALSSPPRGSSRPPSVPPQRSNAPALRVVSTSPEASSKKVAGLPAVLGSSEQRSLAADSSAPARVLAAELRLPPPDAPNAPGPWLPGHSSVPLPPVQSQPDSAAQLLAAESEVQRLLSFDVAAPPARPAAAEALPLAPLAAHTAVTTELMPASSRRPKDPGAAVSLLPATRPTKLQPSPLQSIRPEMAAVSPRQFACIVCAGPTYAATCAACGCYVCPDHQLGSESWCQFCVEEYKAFSVGALPQWAGFGLGALGSLLLSSAAFSAVGSVATRWLSAAVIAATLGAVVLIMRQGLRKSRFLRTRPTRVNYKDQALHAHHPAPTPADVVEPPTNLGYRSRADVAQPVRLESMLTEPALATPANHAAASHAATTTAIGPAALQAELSKDLLPPSVQRVVPQFDARVLQLNHLLNAGYAQNGGAGEPELEHWNQPSVVPDSELAQDTSTYSEPAPADSLLSGALPSEPPRVATPVVPEPAAALSRVEKPGEMLVEKMTPQAEPSRSPAAVLSSPTPRSTPAQVEAAHAPPVRERSAQQFSRSRRNDRRPFWKAFKASRNERVSSR